MCPLIAAPNRGYADYQRLDNFDSGVLWSLTSALSNVQITSPVIDVSRYSRLGGTLSCGTNQCYMTVRWYVDAAASIAIGERDIVLDPNIPNAAVLNLINLGPFVRIFVQNIGGLNFTFNATIIGTNREHPCELIPFTSALAVVTNVPFGVGASQNYSISSYYAGPVLVSASSGGLAIQYVINFTDSSGVDHNVWAWNTATGVLSTQIVVVPAGKWYFGVANNTGSAATVSFCVSASYTGAT